MKTPTKSEMLKILASVMGELMTNGCGWHPCPEVDQDNWNEDASVKLNLTIKECRAIKDILIRERVLPAHWAPQGDSLVMGRLDQQELDAYEEEEEIDE